MFDAEVNGRQISLTDRESGQQVHEIVVNDPRIDPATFVENGLMIGEYQIAVVDEQGVVRPGVAPWGEPSPDWGEPFRGAIHAALFATDRLVALIPTRNQGDDVAISTWTSPDGVNWTGPSQPEFIDE